MNKEWVRIKNIGIYFVVFFCSVLLKSLTLFGVFNMKLLSDNIGVLFTPALLSGRDWSGLIGNYAYYGFAYYILFTPLFVVTNDPYTIYTVICFANIAVLGLIGCIIYHIIRTYIKQISTVSVVILSILCTNYGIVFSWNFQSELPALLSVWLIVLMICKCYDNRKNKKVQIRNTVLLVLILVWAMNVHTRLMMVWLVLVFIILLAFVMYREQLVHLITFAIGTVLGLPFSMMLKKMVIALVWKNSGDSALRNSELISEEKISGMHVGIKNVADIILSNLYKLTMETYGLGWILFIALIFFLIWYLTHRIKNAKKKVSMTENEPLLFSIMLMFAMILVGTICGLVINYGTHIADGFANGVENSLFSGLTYIRYFYIYFGPVVVAGYALIQAYEDVFVKYGVWIILSFAAIVTYIVAAVLPHLSIYFINYTYFKNIENKYVGFAITIVILMASMIVGCVLLSKKRFDRYIVLMLVIMVLVNLPISNSELYHLKPSNRGGNAIYQVIKGISDESIILPQNIYMKDSERAMASIQFLLNDYSVSMGYPGEDESSAWYFAADYDRADASYLGDNGYRLFHLDQNEYLWVKGEALQSAVSQSVDSYLLQGQIISEDTWEFDLHAVKCISYILQYTKGITADYEVKNAPAGLYTFDFTMEYVYAPHETIGEIRILQDDNVLVSKTITIADFYTDAITMSDVYVNEASDLRIEMELGKGVVVKHLCGSYRNNDNSTRLSESEKSQFDYMGSIATRSGIKGEVYLISDQNEYMNMEDFSEANQLLGRTVAGVIDAEHADEFDEEAYIILKKSNDTSLLFDLVERYDILIQTEEYTLLFYGTEKNQHLARKAGIEPVSYTGNIDIDYFRQERFVYPKGFYTIEIGEEALEKSQIEDELQAKIRVEWSAPIEINKDNTSTVVCLPTAKEMKFYGKESVPKEPRGLVYVRKGSKHLPSDTTIMFSNKNPEIHLTNTSGIETWGCWSVDTTNEMLFCVEENCDVIITLQLRSIMAQKVKIYAGETLLMEDMVEYNAKDYTFTVPAECIQEGLLTLKFESESVWNAGEICHTDDKRMIGLGFAWMKVTYK